MDHLGYFRHLNIVCHKKSSSPLWFLREAPPPPQVTLVVTVVRQHGHTFLRAMLAVAYSLVGSPMPDMSKVMDDSDKRGYPGPPGSGLATTTKSLDC
jgi:hypothetical protein